MSEHVHSQPELVRVATKLADALTDPNKIAGLLAEPGGVEFAASLMAQLVRILTSFDVSMSYSLMDDAIGRGTGPIGQLAATVANTYGAKYARLVPHGSSHGNIAIGLALRAKLGRPARVLVDRACHASVAGGLALAGADIIWLPRSLNEALGVQPPFTSQGIAEALDRLGEVDAVWLTLPTYDGILPSDIEGLHRVCRDRNVMLIADSAWGGYLGLLQDAGFPPSPAAFADATVISLHKHGLGLSGASCVLFNDLEFANQFGRFCDMGLVSTSPPFYAAAVLEQTLDDWRGPAGQLKATLMASAANDFRAAMGAVKGIVPVRAESLGSGLSSDPSHQLFSVRDTGLTGYQILSELAERYDIDAEKATPTNILFLFGPEQMEGWQRIVEAVRDIISDNPPAAAVKLPPPPTVLPDAAMSMGEALFRASEAVPVHDAIGRIAGQMVAAYPPGSAIFQPGEIITREHIEYLCALERAGSRFKGIDGPLAAATIIIINDQDEEEL